MVVARRGDVCAATVACEGRRSGAEKVAALRGGSSGGRGGCRCSGGTGSREDGAAEQVVTARSGGASEEDDRDGGGTGAGEGAPWLCAAESWWSRSKPRGGVKMVLSWFARSCDGGRKRLAAAAVWRVEGEEKIRVRVLGDEDDDVAESDWLTWLDGLSPIGVWDVLGSGTHDGHGTGSKLGRLGCSTTDEESVGLDYEQDWLVGLDHERESFVEAQ
ncbi:hypothetical protein DEO72_LG8g1876 [Vigna unguiculata]|uniref:Uncharacterized protein n=1 Tax=Vigna unguiculata TaxID=3917 RepID=A0A4D6MVB7_VIGUN|nr:hypothetical protein DEO72_LG8g1876 [Vigna unguiculata]